MNSQRLLAISTSLADELKTADLSHLMNTFWLSRMRIR